MCRFVPEKNLHHLIEAFSRTEHRECKLVIAGDSDFEDDYSASLKKYAREQGVVLPRIYQGQEIARIARRMPGVSYYPPHTKGSRSHCSKQ